jgi:hypothetical protein
MKRFYVVFKTNFFGKSELKEVLLPSYLDLPEYITLDNKIFRMDEDSRNGVNKGWNNERYILYEEIQIMKLDEYIDN